jgi:hypothetical protein
LNQIDPYETPRSTHDTSKSVVGSRTLHIWLILVPLLALTAWSIYRVSPVGIILPAVIGCMIAVHQRGTIRMMLGCTVLAYVVGVAMIAFADAVTHAYNPFLLNNDDLRVKILRVWAAFGILGAGGGAALGVRFARSGTPKEKAEP